MANEVTIYKGDTFIADGIYRDALGQPVDLAASNISIEAYLKTKDNRRFSLGVSTGGGVGRYHVEGPTDAWPLGRNNLIIRYTQGTIRRTAQPVVILVEAA